jgi:hypothetical protein
VLDRGLEPERAGALGVRAGGPHQGATHVAGACAGCHRETAALPPAQVGVGGGREPHPADDGAVDARHQHDTPGVVVDVVEVVSGEQALLLYEHNAAQPAVGRDRAGVGDLDQQPGRTGPGQARTVEGSEPGRGDLQPGQAGRVEDGHAPATASALHAPHAAQPAPWSAPRIPTASSCAATRRVTSATSAALGGGSAAARVPESGRNGTTNG